MHTSLQYFVLAAGGFLGSIFLFLFPVIPAKAGIHMAFARFAGLWIPAFVGMRGNFLRKFTPNIRMRKHVANLCAQVSPPAGEGTLFSEHTLSQHVCPLAGEGAFQCSLQRYVDTHAFKGTEYESSSSPKLLTYV